MLVSMAPYKIDHSRYEKTKQRIDQGSEPSIVKLLEYGVNYIGDLWDTSQAVARHNDATWNRDLDDKQGFALPGTKYTGPGNSLNRGPGVNEADEDAKLHDEQYSVAGSHKDIQQSDIHLLKNAGDHIAEGLQGKGTLGNSLLSAVQGAGIGAKHLAEKAVGPIYPKTYSTTPTQHMDTNEAEPSRRRAHDNSLETGHRPAKQSKVVSSSGLPAETGGTNDSSETNEVAADMGLTGTGREQASGGASSEGTPPFMIERPLSLFGDKVSTFRKVHKVMTFGLAPAVISGVANTNTRVLTTYLAEIPWHVPAFFLNQSEFNNLSPGSHVVSVSIEVYYRGSTIQFQTNQSATSLATLNQINDIAVATALNRTGWGQNFRYTEFVANNSMVPLSIGSPQYRPNNVVGPPATQYRGMVEDYYGTDNANTNFEEYIPHHQLGRHVFLYNYWGMSTRINPAVPPIQNMYGGWPCLSEKFQQMDGKTVVNTCVLRSEYKPKMAPIKVPLSNIGMGLPHAAPGFTFPVGGNLVNSRMANVTINNASASGDVYNATTETQHSYSTDPGVANFMDIYMPIEKCQAAKSGFWGSQGAHIQPSLHIGVQPVPALSTSALLTTNTGANSWTDSRGYWEIVATMKIKEHTPTAFPYATAPNVPPGDVVQFLPASSWPAAIRDASWDGATFAGLYPTTYHSLP